MRLLFQQIAEGDDIAFRQLFDAYKTKIYFFILHIIDLEAETEELVQDVFLRIWNSRDALGHVQNPDSYLFTMAKNRALDFLRQAAHERAIRNEWGRKNIAEIGTEEKFDLLESKRLVDAAVKILPKQQALVFRLSKEEGLSRREIAQQLNISENTVRNHLAEAIRSIKEYLREHGEIYFMLFIWQYCAFQ